MAVPSGGRPVPRIVVVGSTNLDIVVPVDHIPQPGETVVGGDHYRAPGGKGANQAVACSRLGAVTTFIGCLGDDDAGRTLRTALEGDRVDTTHVRQVAGAPSGIALIVVDGSGENTVTVSPGANARLLPDTLPEAEIEAAAALLVQLEIPLATATRAAELATGTVVLNPAPGRPLPDELLRNVDVLVPNRSELAVLSAAQEPERLEDVAALAQGLPGDARVVVTLGDAGAVVVDGDDLTHVPAHRVTAVDATGAGDTFCAALTVALTEGAELVDATRWAVVAAGLSVAGRGAQPSIPVRADVTEAIATGG